MQAFRSLLHMAMKNLQHANSYLHHVGSSSLSKDRTGAPCAGSMESKPLDHQGSAMILLLSNGEKGKQKL